MLGVMICNAILKHTSAAVFATAVLGTAGHALAAPTGQTSNATGAAAAQVVKPIAAVSLADLDFGLVSSDTAGSVTIVAGEKTARYSGGARRACDQAQTCPAEHPARFLVTGESGRSYRVAVPDRLTISGAQGDGQGATLFAVALTVKTASRSADGPEGTLDAQGSDTFEIGGTLRLPAMHETARYTVSVPVIVTYS